MALVHGGRLCHAARGSFVSPASYSCCLDVCDAAWSRALSGKTLAQGAISLTNLVRLVCRLLLAAASTNSLRCNPAVSASDGHWSPCDMGRSLFRPASRDQTKPMVASDPVAGRSFWRHCAPQLGIARIGIRQFCGRLIIDGAGHSLGQPLDGGPSLLSVQQTSPWRHHCF